MTLDDALKTFGLKRLLTKPALKVLRDSQAKEAAARGDEDALIRINAAWAVLTGKSDAAPTDESGANGPQGLIRAHCARKSGQVFILDWTMSPRAGQGGADKIVLDNPQLISWDDDLGLYQIVGASGEAKPYYGETNGPSSADSGLFTQGWASQFRGEITFAPVACPCCQAEHIQWCQHCNTVFCHGGPKDTPEGRYRCPRQAAPLAQRSGACWRDRHGDPQSPPEIHRLKGRAPCHANKRSLLRFCLHAPFRLLPP